MLHIDLSRLRRTRTLPLDASIDPDADLWTGSELRFSAAVQISGSAVLTADGGVVVQGSWRAPVRYDCGRCLKELDLTIERPLTVLYTPDHGWEPDDTDVRTVGYRDAVLDLGDAIREEVLLDVPRYHVPEDEDGHCTECGDSVERFRYVAEEAGAGTDPRWSALKALQTD